MGGLDRDDSSNNTEQRTDRGKPGTKNTVVVGISRDLERDFIRCDADGMRRKPEKEKQRGVWREGGAFFFSRPSSSPSSAEKEATRSCVCVCVWDVAPPTTHHE
jgi:hypothetical protein